MTTTAIFICAILTLAYVLLMLAYRRGWTLTKEFSPGNFIPSTAISVIIPARNEAANISRCINAVLAQDYPAHLVEIIVVDDHSEDNTYQIVLAYKDNRIKCIKLSEHLNDGKINAYKKAALAAGIAHSNGTLIVTTDADCTSPSAWLTHMAAIYAQQQPALIIAPVVFTAENKISAIFQLIDFMSMQGITAATNILHLGQMGNGANLAFTRAAYDAVNGYEGTTYLASGDDYLFISKVSKAFPGRITYLRSAQAIVSTVPQPNWSSFMQQRIRWASKSGKYDDKKLTAILLMVYLFNFSFLPVFITAFFHHSFFFLLLVMLGIKILAELTFLIPVAKFFRHSSALWYFPFLQPLHIGYIIIAGFLGYKGGYTWKGRTVH